nr:MAG TPA: hypothetical protein [Caudoviricetes sp.]
MAPYYPMARENDQIGEFWSGFIVFYYFLLFFVVVSLYLCSVFNGRGMSVWVTQTNSIP